MPAELVLERGTDLFRALHAAAVDRRCVFVAGLPGVGKSLVVQQLAVIATEAGRPVHLLQWDVARRPFDTPEILARYPEVGGVTHAAIRLAVGAWAREAVPRWDERHPDPRHVLIGETPLVGERLMELARPRPDPLEALLAGERTEFVIPVPTREVRREIEGARVRDMSGPRNARETASAPPDLVRWHWDEIARIARELGVTVGAPGGDYDPDLYAAVYQRLLRHRRTTVLPIARVLAVRGSAFDLPAVAGELLPTASEVAVAIAAVSRWSDREIEERAAAWYRA